MAEVYAEYGVVGVVVLLFSGMLVWFKGFIDKLVNNKMEDLENEIQQNRDITVKLIDRWNESDSNRDRRHEQLIENADRRHEKITSNLKGMSERLYYIEGKLERK